MKRKANFTVLTEKEARAVQGGCFSWFWNFCWWGWGCGGGNNGGCGGNTPPPGGGGGTPNP